MTPVRILSIVLVLFAMLALAPVADAAPRKVPRGFHGVMHDGLLLDAPDSVRDQQFALMARSGVETIRTVFVWSHMQPYRSVPLSFERTDRTVRSAVSHGIQILPVLLAPPPWARVFPRRDQSPPRVQAYLEYTRASIRRYGSNGSFWRENPDLPKRPIRDWQVWNEPNIKAFWDVPRRSKLRWPRGYANLLKATNRVIKRTDRRARTVTGGLIGLSWLELQRLVNAGARNSFDIAGLHVYSQSERRVLAAVRKARSTLRKLGLRRRGIYLTETAFPASRGKTKPIGDQRQETPKGMARRLDNVFGILSRGRRRLGLGKIFWYTWSSSYRPPSNFEFAGLLSTRDGITYRPQPGLTAFRRVARRYQGCAKNDRGACR